MYRPTGASSSRALMVKMFNLYCGFRCLRRLPSAQAKPKKAVARKPFANDESIEQAYTIVWPILFYICL